MNGELQLEAEVPKFWAALGVRAVEVRAIRGLFVVAFLMGLALVAFYGASNALFLTSYDIDVLPWVYIANAGMVIAVGLLYSVASRHLGLHQVLIGSTVMIAASVVGLWLWAVLSDTAVVAFMMAAWFRLLFIFALLGLWEIASAIFDVRQAKRLFPAVALGTMLAFMLGGALTGPVIAAIGTVHLVLVSGICFALYAAGFASVLKTEMSSVAPDTTPPAGPIDIIGDSYSRLLAAMRSVTILLVFIGEFIFYEQSAATFDDADSLATFLGIFIGSSTLVMVVVTAVGAARYIAHFGIRVALMTMPAGIGIAALAAAIWGTLVGVDKVFFGLVVLSMVANSVLSNAVETPVGAVMFQPLPTDRRMPVRVAVDGWLGSVALLVAGFLLLGFAAADFDTVVPFTWLLAGIGVAGIWMANQLYGGYKGALRTATTRAFNGQAALPISADDPTLRVVGGSAAGFGTGSLLTLGDGEVDPLIDSMLGHSDPRIVEVALESGVALSASGAERQGRLARAVERSDLSGTARARALHALAGNDQERALALAHQASHSDLPDLKAAAMALRYRDQDDHQLVVDELQRLTQTGNVEDRLAAARVLHNIHGGLPHRITEALLVDNDESVQQHALQAVEGKVTSALTATVLRVGTQPALQRLAVLALAESGPEVLDPVTSALNAQSTEYQADLVEHVLGRHTRRPALLHPFVAPTQPAIIRHAGFTAIQQAAIAPPASPERMLRDDIEMARHLATAWRDVSTEMPTFGWAIEAEFDQVRSSIYRAIAIDLDASRIHDIEAIAFRGNDEDRANAIEALDVMLRSELRRQIIPILEPQTIADACNEFADLPPSQAPALWAAELGRDSRLRLCTTRIANHFTDPEQGPTMTAQLERIVALKGVDIFSTLPYPLLAELAETVQPKTFAAGQKIIVRGALDQELFALTEGTVTVSRDDGNVSLHAGTVFGELAVLDPAPRSADVTATTDCTVLVVRRDMLLALVDRRPEVMIEIAGVLARRLRTPHADES